MIRAQRSAHAKHSLRVEEDAQPTSPEESRARNGRGCRVRRRKKIMLLFAILIPLAGLLTVSTLSVYLQPRFIINLLAKMYPDVVFFATTTKKIIALTIDDAPTGDTPEILDILQENNAKATFFCIGHNIVHQDPSREILKRIRDEGHEFGNHMSFDSPSYQLDDKEFTKQLLEVDALLEEITQGDPPATKWFRPGSGFFSGKMVADVKKHKYTTALGDVYPHDPMIKFSSVNSYFVINRVHPGAIVILHNRPWTIDTLCTILPKLTEMGYTITTLSELLKHDTSDRSSRLSIKSD